MIEVLIFHLKNILIDFEGARLEIEYWSGSLVRVNTTGGKEMEILSTFVEKSKNVIPFSSKAM